MPFRQPLITAVLVVALLLDLSCRADAKIVEKDNLRLGSALLELIEQSSQDFDRQAFLVINLGAASMLIRSAVSSSDSIQHPELVQNAIQAMGWDDVTVEWSTDQGYSVARSRVGKGKLFVREAETTHKVGLLLKAFEDAGFTPVAEVGVIHYAEAVGHQPTRYGERSSWERIYSGSETRQITVKGHIDNIGFALASALLILPYVIILIGLMVAVRFARDENLPKGTRLRRLRIWTVLPPICVNVGLLIAHFPFGQSAHAAPASDIWLGSTSHTSFMLLLFVPNLMLVTILALPFLEWHFIGCRGETEELSPEMRADLKRKAFRQMVIPVLGVLVAAIFAFLLEGNTTRVIMGISGFAFAMGIQRMVMDALGQPTTYEPTHVPPTDELHQRADDLALRLDVPFKELVIDGSAEGTVFIRAHSDGEGQLSLSRKAIEIMTPEELDFLMARGFCQVKPPSVRVLLLPLLLMAVLTIVFWGKGPLISIVVPFTVLALIGLNFLLTRAYSNAEKFRDAAALRVTGSLLAAESALLKMMKYGPEPEIDEDVDSHPKLAARVEYLRRKSGK